MKKKIQNMNDILIKGLQKSNIILDENQIEALVFHSEEMLRWNKKTNLTSITDLEEVAVKHIVDSCILSKYCSGYDKILDIGTGAGYPGIPLKILLPDVDVTLVETIRKKVSFLKHIIRSLKLDKIKAVQARGEEQSNDEAFSGKFDAVVCRAFSGLDKFVNMAIPYLNENGVIFAMKGREKDHETELLKKVDASFFNGRRITFNDLNIELTEYKLPIIVSDRVLFTIRVKN